MSGPMKPGKGALDKWSHRQLVAEVERLRREAGTTPADAAKAESEDARLRARVAVLTRRLAEAGDDAAFRGIALEQFAGRPALAKLRRAWTEFVAAVERLPDHRAAFGMAEVRARVAAELVPDLYLMGLTPPRSAGEAAERDQLRRYLDDPAFVAVMARPEPWASRLRTEFVSAVARTYLRVSVWRTFDRGTDEGALDKKGNVYK